MLPIVSRHRAWVSIIQLHIVELIRHGKANSVLQFGFFGHFIFLALVRCSYFMSELYFNSSSEAACFLTSSSNSGMYLPALTFVHHGWALPTGWAMWNFVILWGNLDLFGYEVFFYHIKVCCDPYQTFLRRSCLSAMLMTSWKAILLEDDRISRKP